MKELYIDVHNSDVDDVHRHRNVKCKKLKGMVWGEQMATVSGNKSRKSEKSWQKVKYLKKPLTKDKAPSRLPKMQSNPFICIKCT